MQTKNKNKETIICSVYKTVITTDESKRIVLVVRNDDDKEHRILLRGHVEVVYESDDEIGKEINKDTEEVNRIIDKIREYGFEKLTPDECEHFVFFADNILNDSIIRAAGYWINTALFEADDIKIRIIALENDEDYELYDEDDDLYDEDDVFCDEDEEDHSHLEKSVEEIVSDIITEVDDSIYSDRIKHGSDLHSILNDIAEFTEDYLYGGSLNQSAEVMTKVCDIVIRSYYSRRWKLKEQTRI